LELITKRRAQAQLVFCLGCCCGRTDRGRPELPVDQLKEIWRTEKLNRTVQLTISGCLGPCDLANVALVMLPEGNVWLGAMQGSNVYETLVTWARDCHAADTLLPLPETLEPLRFERFAEQDPPSEHSTEDAA
jgi:cobaltochelatase CobN